MSTHVKRQQPMAPQPIIQQYASMQYAVFKKKRGKFHYSPILATDEHEQIRALL